MSITLETDEPETQELIRDWIKIGRGNPWIKYACDPPFNEISFCECSSIDELEGKIGHGNWCLGAAFFYNVGSKGREDHPTCRVDESCPLQYNFTFTLLSLKIFPNKRM